MSAARNQKRQRRRRRSGLVAVLNGILTLVILGIQRRYGEDSD